MSIFTYDILAYITGISSLFLALITWYYAKTTNNILVQSQQDTKIAYIRSRLENYYYPIHYFLSQCYIVTEEDSFSFSEIESDNVCLDEEYIGNIKQIYFKSKNRLLFNEIHKFQYLGTRSMIEETDFLVSMIQKRLKEEQDRYLHGNKLKQAQIKNNQILSENRRIPYIIIFNEKDEIHRFCSYFNKLNAEIKELVDRLKNIIK